MAGDDNFFVFPNNNDYETLSYEVTLDSGSYGSTSIVWLDDICKKKIVKKKKESKKLVDLTELK